MLWLKILYLKLFRADIANPEQYLRRKKYRKEGGSYWFN